MNKRKWVIGFLSSVMLLLGLVAGSVIVVDPFLQYHKPIPGFAYVIDNQYTQNPGMAKQLDYDSVILGSSMTSFFDTEWFRDRFGLNTLRLTCNASGGLEQDRLLNIMERREDIKLKQVFLGMDLSPYRREIGQGAYEVEGTYYDDCVINDAAYWWNLDVLTKYILEPIRLGKKQERFLDANVEWYDGTLYCTENALANYNPVQKESTAVKEEAYRSLTEENLKTYILPHIETLSDTKFTVFFPPYSMLYWHDALQQNNLEAQLEQYRLMAELLLPYENVELYFFPNDAEIVTNLDRYKDYTHYDREVHEYMTDCFLSGEKKLTRENYPEEIQKLKDLILQQDFAQWGL